MRKAARLAACEPCRQMKLACDHAKPSCSRCLRLGREDACMYRERPFKKRRHGNDVDVQNTLDGLPDPGIEVEHEPISPLQPLESPQTDYRYPNPGYLGPSSHATIFNRLPTDSVVQEQSPTQAVSTLPGTVGVASIETPSNQQIWILRKLFAVVDVEAFQDLIRFWLARGINLTLGGLLVLPCMKALYQIVSNASLNTTDVTTLAKTLSRNSARALATRGSSTFIEFCREFCDSRTRWETLALALAAVGRATTDIAFFPPLYTNRTQLKTFRQLVTSLSDRCLEIALALDCLNDIQLICQYENWILHSVVDGDQSFNSWRRLGDVISSLLFLGYHEEIRDDSTTPSFLLELRKSTFAMVYSDDKNIAVFLGRPPRLNRSFCHFQLPTATSPVLHNGANEDHMSPGQNERMNHNIMIRWTASCARLKEEILEVLQKRDQPLNERQQKFVAIYARAQDMWTKLPEHLQLQKSLSSHKEQSPFEKDFLINFRLTFLQILFLLANGRFTQSNDNVVSGDSNLLPISQEMLSLVVEAVILRDQLANSGTGLVWKVAHYGLPAAGMICLSVLHPSLQPEAYSREEISKIVQDLSVFVAEIQMGGLIQPGEPNYALLHRATCTIQSLLKATLSLGNALHPERAASDINMGTTDNELEQPPDVESLNTLLPVDLWGGEYDFWQNLGEHPLLSTSQRLLNPTG